jgi:tetratricopeptide (TPR) repeat protein
MTHRIGSIILVLLVAACGGSETHARVEHARAPAPAPRHAAAPTGPPQLTLEHLAQGAALVNDLGSYHHPVTTHVPEAQAFFDQGLRLMYGFNHDEAARSFARGAQLDPTCAMCFWGAAYTLGPNYNFPMFPDRAAAAWDAIQRAQHAAAATTPVEQALIGALAHRYGGPEPLEAPAMQPFIEAYATAMRDVAHRFPDDLDVQVLFAESMMDVRPWKLWGLDGTPAPGTDEIVSTLESVLSRNPDHPGANHYYIHAVEASPHPERAVASAERLGSMMPGAGHLVHMPAHIFQRVGRYAEASETNRRAIDSDNQYMRRTTPPGYYAFYLGHNYGFLAFSASMEGRAEEALEASRHAAESIPRDAVCGMPGMDFFLSEPLLVEVRFGRWADVFAEQRPPDRYPILLALWHHAHGMASASTDKLDDARQDVAEIRRIATTVPDDMLAGLNAGRQVLELAAKIVEARIAEREHRPEAIDLWQQAVTVEDGLAYDEPADWFYPVRHYLGAALLDAGRAADAEAVYRTDLAKHPNNGWALFGLARAQRAQHHNRDAAATEARFHQAFAHADITLERSAY